MPPKAEPSKKTTTAAKKSVKKGGGDVANNVFACGGQISTLPNADRSYVEVGVVHVTKVAGINAARGFMTQISNAFGSSGAEGSVFDNARTQMLTEMLGYVKGKPQKICGLRIDMEFKEAAVLVTGYGTLLQKAAA